MNPTTSCAALIAVSLFWVPPAVAQMENGRAAALDYLGRGTAAFRAGDITAETRDWSEAIRWCRLTGAPDFETQALARRGEAYRVAGYFRDAGNDLQAALAKAEHANDESLIAASSGALGNLAFMSRRTAVAESLLKRSRNFAGHLRDPAILAASDNDLGNLYASAGRGAEAASAYTEAITSAEAAGDDALAATAEINAARLALRRQDPTGVVALLKRAVDRLERLPTSYNRGMALVSAGSAGFESKGPLASDARTVAARDFRGAADTAEMLRSPTLSSLAQGGLAHLHERENQLDEALRLTDRAAFAAQQACAPKLSFRWDWQRARLALRRGQTETALTDYGRAIAELQSVRQEIPVEYRDGQSSYRTTFGPVNLQFSDLLLRRASADPARATPLIRELLEKRTTNEYLVPARQLYDQIIRPIEPVLAAHHIDTLVIVPDYAFRTVPFSALHDGAGFLLDRYATAIVPSLYLTDPGPLNIVSGTALVLGISKSVQGYAPLPNVEREVAAVHDIQGGQELLSDAFSRARFEAELKHVPYNGAEARALQYCAHRLARTVRQRSQPDLCARLRRPIDHG